MDGYVAVSGIKCIGVNTYCRGRGSNGVIEITRGTSVWLKASMKGKRIRREEKDSRLSLF